MNKEFQVQEIIVNGYFPSMTDSFLEECLSAMNIEYTWIASTSSTEQQTLIEKAKWKFGRDVSAICLLRLHYASMTVWYITLQQNTQEMIDVIGRLNKLRIFL